jgi:gas vesicle protein
MKENNSGKSFLLGILVGGAVGAIFALLYAPTSGKRLRKEIVHKKDELVKDANKYLRKAKIQASEIIDEGRRKAEEIIYDAKKKVASLTDTAGSLVKRN